MGGDKVEPKKYKVLLEDRKALQADGVNEVESFDERQVIALSKLGPLVVRGEQLHITQLNLEAGQLSLEGIINSIEYIEDKQAQMKARGKGVLARLFK